MSDGRILQNCDHHFTHNIQTCQGSSGAPLFHLPVPHATDGHWPFALHFAHGLAIKLSSIIGVIQKAIQQQTTFQCSMLRFIFSVLEMTISDKDIRMHCYRLSIERQNTTAIITTPQAPKIIRYDLSLSWRFLSSASWRSLSSASWRSLSSASFTTFQCSIDCFNCLHIWCTTFIIQCEYSSTRDKAPFGRPLRFRNDIIELISLLLK